MSKQEYSHFVHLYGFIPECFIRWYCICWRWSVTKGHWVHFSTFATAIWVLAWSHMSSLLLLTTPHFLHFFVLLTTTVCLRAFVLLTSLHRVCNTIPAVCRCSPEWACCICCKIKQPSWEITKKLLFNDNWIFYIVFQTERT